MRRIVWPLVLLALTLPAFGQRVDRKNTHYRAWAVDYVTTDAQGLKMPAHAAGKLGWVAMYSADGSLCVVEYVAKDYHDLDSLRRDSDPRVKVWEKASTPRQLFEGVARTAGFTALDLDKFFVAVP